MKLQPMDDFGYPKRRPWLPAIVVLVALGVWFARSRRQNSGGEQGSDQDYASTIEAMDAVDANSRSSGNAGTDDLMPREDDLDAAGAMPADLDAARRLLADGRRLEKGGDLAGAREKLYDALRRAGAGGLRREIEDALGTVNMTMLLSPRPMPEKESYVVQSGDTIDKIARKYGTTVELICKSNNIKNPNVIRAGDQRMVFKGQVEVVVSKKRNDLLLVVDNRFFKRYPVGTGKFGKTPAGTFVINDKILHPVWWKPDGKSVPYGHPENILGTHWMALKATGETPDVRGYGIHGTWDDSSIGKAESAGCIRLRNPDVEELFTILPLGTKVTILE